jgi:hypothetical protein
MTMDSSGYHHELALQHALRGVEAKELSPEGRAKVLQEAIKRFLNWGRHETPPGFQPYGERYSDSPIEFCVPHASRDTKVLELALRFGAGFERTLLITMDGQILEEKLSLVNDDWVTQVLPCEEARLARLMNEDPRLLDKCIRNLKLAAERRKIRLNRSLEKTDQILGRLAQLR